MSGGMQKCAAQQDVLAHDIGLTLKFMGVL
jgi:hypothetical protein